MSKTHKVAGVAGSDPTLPMVELTLGETTYNLAFTFAALATAASQFRARGIQCKLMYSLDLTEMDADRLGPLLYATLITNHPKITIDEAEALITMSNIGLVFQKIVEAYGASLADPTKKSGTEGKA